VPLNHQLVLAFHAFRRMMDRRSSQPIPAVPDPYCHFLNRTSIMMPDVRNATTLQKVLDFAENQLCKRKLLQQATWERLMAEPVRFLYAGRLRRGLPQYETHFGLTPYFASSRNICHDVTRLYPLPDASIDRYQSEDVFEHVPYAGITAMFDEIHRILRPGALFRLSLPDYHFDGYRDRSLRNEAGEIVFDPAGGGSYVGGQVTGGGHAWFPTIQLVRQAFEASRFAGQARYLRYTLPNGEFVAEPIDYSLGHIQRTMEHDARVTDRPRPLSIVVDAIKA
jgi:SAM-dependent methyltransferase